MRILLGICLCLCAAQLFGSVQIPDGNVNSNLNTEHIKSYESYVTILENGDIQLREVITVNARGEQIRHGIYRQLPLTFKLPESEHWRKTPWEILSVKRNGKKEPFHIEKSFTQKVLYIGSRLSHVPTGESVYEIEYTSKGHLFHKDGRTYFYFNAVGMKWQFGIHQVGLVVEYPESWELQEHTTLCTEQGSQKCLSQEAVDGNIFKSTYNNGLLPSEAFTVVLAWPEQVMAVKPWYFDWQYEIYMLLLLIGVSTLSYFIWLKKGKDHTDPHFPIQNKPPKGLTPYMAAVMRYMKVTSTAFKASILTIAAKGGLTIEFKDDRTVSLESTQDQPPPELSKLDRFLHKVLFKSRRKIVMKGKHHARLYGAYTQYDNHLRKEVKAAKLFSRNVLWWLPSLLVAIVGFIVVVNQSFAGSAGQNNVLLLMALVSILGPLLIFNILLAAENVQNGLKWFFAIFTGALVLFLLLLSVNTLGVLPVLLEFLLFGQLGFWLRYLPAPTEKGRMLMNHLIGYRKFLEISKDDFESEQYTHHHEETQMHLAFAVALGVEYSFLLREEAIRAKPIHEWDDNRFIILGPFWLHSHRGFDFANDFGHGTFEHSVNSSTSAPSSGGGFTTGGFSSGGGSGGGGGGGW